MILVFNGKNYESQSIINQSRQGFEALVSVGELDTSLAVPDIITKVVYEFAGKKYLLVGSIGHDAANVKVRIITKHLLKKCEVIEEARQALRQYQSNGYSSYSQDRGFSGHRY